MRLTFEQLRSRLTRGLDSVYLVTGDEPLQVEDALSSVRSAARSHGFAERVVLRADADFDWTELAHYTDNLSLFANQRLVELRLAANTRIGEPGASVLIRYASRPNPDTVLLLSSTRLDVLAKRSAWYRALAAAGVTVEVWPVDAAALPIWVRDRAKMMDLGMTQGAAALIAERNEGNLLACAQEIEKLRLVYGAGPVDIDDVMLSVADSARFDVFELIESTLIGNVQRTLRILLGLRKEGIEPVLVLGTLAWEIRSLAGFSRQWTEPTSLEQVLTGQRVWNRRKHAVKVALKRHRLEHWLKMVNKAAHIDRVIKGLRPGNAWDELQQLGLMVCGVPVLASTIEQ